MRPLFFCKQLRMLLRSSHNPSGSATLVANPLFVASQASRVPMQTFSHAPFCVPPACSVRATGAGSLQGELASPSEVRPVHRGELLAAGAPAPRGRNLTLPPVCCIVGRLRLVCWKTFFLSPCYCYYYYPVPHDWPPPTHLHPQRPRPRPASNTAEPSFSSQPVYDHFIGLHVTAPPHTHTHTHTQL